MRAIDTRDQHWTKNPFSIKNGIEDQRRQVPGHVEQLRQLEQTNAGGCANACAISRHADEHRTAARCTLVLSHFPIINTHAGNPVRTVDDRVEENAENDSAGSIVHPKDHSVINISFQSTSATKHNPTNAPGRTLAIACISATFTSAKRREMQSFKHNKVSHNFERHFKLMFNTEAALMGSQLTAQINADRAEVGSRNEYNEYDEFSDESDDPAIDDR